MKLLTCQCGKPFEVAAYRVSPKARYPAKYCSADCAQLYRAYETKAETLSYKLTVPLSERQRVALETRADLQGQTITVCAREIISRAIGEE